MKKWLIVVVLLIVALFLTRGLFSGAEEPKKELESKPPAALPWSGAATRTMNLKFNSGRWEVRSLQLKGLNSKESSVTVTILTPGRKAPGWLKQGVGQVTGSRLIYRPAVSSAPVGSQTRTELRFKGVRTDLLGPDCQGQQRQALSLSFAGAPGPDVQILLSAPAPPPGNCLGEGRQAKPRAAIKRTKVLKNNKVVVYGRVFDSDAKKVIIDVRGPSKKARAGKTINNGRFQVVFKLPPGKYRARAGLKPGQWTDQATITVR